MARMTEKLLNKLADQRGDSMVEALAAILIAVLGATMLATMVMASVNVSMKSQSALDASFRAETGLFASAGAQAKITYKLGDAAAEELDVTLYASDGYQFYEYRDTGSAS